jgi:hypothetical protein
MIPQRRCIHCNAVMLPFFYNKPPYRLQGFKCTCGVWERAVSDEKQWTSNDFHNKTKIKTQKTEDRSEA